MKILIVITLISISFFAESREKNKKKIIEVKPENSAEVIEFTKLPSLSKESQLQKIKLGGFSALQFINKNKNKYYFKTITDRGPNGSEVEITVGDEFVKARPFLIPDFSPQVVEFYFDAKSKKIKITKQDNLYVKGTSKVNGLPMDNEKSKVEFAVDSGSHKLDNSTIGMDSEGYCEVGQSFYVSDEYGPNLFKFDLKNNQFTKVFKSGAELPEEWINRKMNRGLEGLSCNKDIAYLMMQSPLPDEDYISIAEFDLTKEKINKKYKYPVDAKQADKIGDLAHIQDKKFLVIEQNGKLGKFKSVRSLYEIDLAKSKEDGQLEKKLIVDLNELNLDQFEKIEGLAVVDNQTVALIVDNDFALDPNIEKKENKLIIKIKENSGSYLIWLKLKDKLY